MVYGWLITFRDAGYALLENWINQYADFRAIEKEEDPDQREALVAEMEGAALGSLIFVIAKDKEEVVYQPKLYTSKTAVCRKDKRPPS